MNITINGALLTTAVSQIVKTTGAKQISVRAEDDSLILTGTDKGRTMETRIDAVIKKSGAFTALPEALTGVCRNRKEIKLLMAKDESKVHISVGNYAADITILPYIEISLEEPEGTELDMASAELRVLLDACGKAQLSEPHKEGAPPLPLHVTINKKGTHVASLDAYHVASVRTRQVTRDEELTMVLPTGALTSISSAAGADSYRIVLADSAVYADNEKFRMILPLEQSDTGNLNLTHVEAMRSKISKSSNGVTASVNYDDLLAILDNVFAVSEANVPIEFTVDDGTLSVGTNSSYGSAVETLDVTSSGEGTFRFNPALVSEVFYRMNGDRVELVFLPTFMYIAHKTGETTSLFIVQRSAA